MNSESVEGYNNSKITGHLEKPAELSSVSTLMPLPSLWGNM